MSVIPGLEDGDDIMTVVMMMMAMMAMMVKKSSQKGFKFTIDLSKGPLPETLADFWRMVWEQRSSTIVMLTRLVFMMLMMILLCMATRLEGRARVK